MKIAKSETQVVIGKAEAQVVDSALRGDYLKLNRKALKCLERILDADFAEAVSDEKGPTGEVRINAALAKVQKDVAEAIIEEAGAKKTAAKGGISLGVQVNNEVKSARKPEIENVSSILESCQIEQDEKKLIAEGK